MEAKDNFAA